MKMLKIIYVLVIVSMLAIGCGSGGSDTNPNPGSNDSNSTDSSSSDSGGSNSYGNSDNGGSVTYNGSSSQVTIDENNAESIATNAYGNSNSMRSMQDSSDILSAVKSGSNDQKGSRPFTIALAQTVMEFMDQAEINKSNSANLISAVLNESMSGTCGGSTSASRIVNDSTLDFNITATFSSYCTDGDGITGGVVIDGVMQMNVTVQSSTSLNMDITFNNFVVTLIDTGVSATTSGSTDMVINSSSATITMNMVMRDDSSGDTYKVENFLINMYDISSYSAYFNISGRFFDSEYGYTDITTEEDFYLILSDDAPSDGIIVITGANGTAGGSTKAQLIVLSRTQYQVVADTNGDGTFDYYTGPRNW